MNLFKLYFSWKDEISRLPYFLAYLALSALFCFVVGGSFVVLIILGFVSGSSIAFAGSFLIWAMFMLPLFLLYYFCCAVLVVKRLHDIGLSGKHIFWIYGMGFVSGFFSIFDNIIAQIIYVLLGLAQLGVFLWLLFKPGEFSYGGADLKETFR